MTFTARDLMSSSAVQVDHAPHWWRVLRWSMADGLDLALMSDPNETLKHVMPERVSAKYDSAAFQYVILHPPKDWANITAGEDAARAIALEICKWFGVNPDESVSAPGYDPRWSYIAASYGKAIERALNNAGYEIKRIGE